MEQPKYLIDSNADIDYLGKKLPPNGMDFMNLIIDSVPKISVVTKIEVLGFNAPEDHYKLLVNFMDDSTILEITNKIADTSIELRKNLKTKLPDALITATALVHDLVLITRNTSDFENIPGLKIINPYSL